MPLRLIVAPLGISLVFIAPWASAQSNPAPKAQACTVANVGVEIGNPFIARYMTKSTSTSSTNVPRMPEILEIVARDSSGRVRIEKHGEIAAPNGSDSVVLHTRDGGQINTTHAELNVVTMIFDCPDGKMIRLQPGMRIAHVDDEQTVLPALRGEHRYSAFFTSLLRHNPTADLVAEDLGQKTIEEIDALGIKTTQIGSEEDEWKGKPIRIFEKWVSDDLAAMLVDTVIDFKKNMQTTSALTSIRRIEPDASLFVIPAEYKINPTSAEMPFQLGAEKSVVVQPKQ